jgi:hypothetical protein
MRELISLYGNTGPLHLVAEMVVNTVYDPVPSMMYKE